MGLSNFTIAEVNRQGVIILIVASIIVPVALSDDIIKCRQAIGLRFKWTSSRCSGLSPSDKARVLPIVTIANSKVNPGKNDQLRT